MYGYLVLALMLIFSVTYSRYTNVYDSESVLTPAKWEIKVNGQAITDTISSISDGIVLVKDGGSSDEIIRAGDTGYFEIEIDPRGTEVSIDYNLSFEVVKVPTNMSSNFLFTGYSLNDEDERHALVDNEIGGDNVVSLNGMSHLGDLEIRRYKIYWKWTGSDLVNNPGDSYINANITIRQYID